MTGQNFSARICGGDNAMTANKNFNSGGMMYKFVGFSGKIGTGKSYLANLVCGLFQARRGEPLLRVSFGKVLKDEVSIKYGLSENLLHTQDGKDFKITIGMGFARSWPIELTAPEWIENGVVTPREILQWYGTEYTRARDADYWVNAVKSLVDQWWAKEAHEYDSGLVIVDDVRFPDELALINKNGICYRLEPYPGWGPGPHSAHASETSLDNVDPQLFHRIFYPAFGGLGVVADAVIEDILDMYFGGK